MRLSTSPRPRAASRSGSPPRSRRSRRATPTASSRSPRTRASSTRHGSHSIQDDSPIPDYAFPGIDDARLATGLAGFVGTLGVFALGFGIAWACAARRRSRDGAAMSGSHRSAPGVAGDPREPDPPPRPAGEAARARRGHGRRGLDAARAWPVLRRLRARAGRGRRARARRPGHDLAPRAGRAPAGAVRRRRSCRSSARARRRSLGPFDVSERRASRCSRRSARRRSSARSAPSCSARRRASRDVLHALERLRAPRLLDADRGVHVPLPVRDRRRGAADARGARRARLRAAPRAAGRRDRPRRDRAVPAHATSAASASTWRCSRAATPARCRAWTSLTFARADALFLAGARRCRRCRC